MEEKTPEQLAAEQAAADQAAGAADQATKTKTSKKVKARVLVDGPYGKVNDVVVVDAATLKADVGLDGDPSAVAYAESLLRK